MGSAVTKFIHLGVDEEGRKWFEKIKLEAIRQGFIHRNGEANFSSFAFQCIKHIVSRHISVKNS